MIQEKDFINKASIKTAQVRMSDGQISTPEILVTEKGDFTGGNILDANSVAELINSSSASGDYVQYSAKSTEDYTIPLQFIVANNINQGTTKISSAGIHHSDQGDLDFCKGTLVFEQNNKTFGMAFDNQEDKYDYAISANDSDDRFHFNKDIAIPGCISLRAALQSKQDAGNYLPYKTFYNRDNKYEMQDDTTIAISGDLYKKNTNTYINGYSFQTLCPEVARGAIVQYNAIEISDDVGARVRLSDVGGGQIIVNQQFEDISLTISKDGIKLLNGDDNHVLTSYGSTIDITQYARKAELPKKVSQLQNDSEFIVKSVYDEKIAALEARIAALEAKHTEATA